MEKESVENLVLDVFTLNEIDDVKEGNKLGTVLWKPHTLEYEKPLNVNTPNEATAFDGYTNDVLYLAAMRLVNKGLLRVETEYGNGAALFIVQTPVEIVAWKKQRSTK
jgi:hypothetical protein